MIDRATVFEIHRLADEGLSLRKIAFTLGISRDSVVKYFKEPLPDRAAAPKASKLDPFKDEISRLLDINPKVSAVVVRQRLMEKGFDGGVTIVKDYLKQVRPKPASKRAFLRFESLPGEQIQLDWGHFGSLPYGNTKRKLYCLAVLECHSRLLYLEFTHSQKQEAVQQGLLHAFQFMGGTCREAVVDNMVTAVIERVGPVVRFNDAFLEFLRPFKIKPFACHKAQPQEKGKVENIIKYIRYNFWPLRTFKNLAEVQIQADHWRDNIANVRNHATTGQRPVDRFEALALRPLPQFLPDCRETSCVKVHKDFSIRFDANSYTVPPDLVGQKLMVKADHETVYIYDSDKLVATHHRTWERKKRIESKEHIAAARRKQEFSWRCKEEEAFLSLGPEAKNYLQKMADSGCQINKSIQKILSLKDEYGVGSILAAMRRAESYKAYGPDYIENILYQEMTPIRNHGPVVLQNQALNNIRLTEPNLAEYDAMIVKRSKAND